MLKYSPEKMKIMMIVGARPNFMKLAPVLERMKRYHDFLEPIIVHTGQHYDHNLSGQFFADLEISQPDIHLEVGSGSHAEQTAKIMIEFEKVINEHPPHLVVVVGDVNSTLACALVAAKCKILIAHIEAGLRCGDMAMPEEINRVLTDRISDYLFPSESSGYQNLINEGMGEESVFFVGNVMIDSLMTSMEKARESQILETHGLQAKNYILLTLHRPENVDDMKILKNILVSVETIAKKTPVVFACHPRTRLNIDKFGLTSYLAAPGIRILEPLGYLDFLKLESEAALVLTDSGGIQEETTVLNVPCLTLRTSTERPVTVTEGTNTLVGSFPERIAAETEKILRGHQKAGSIPKYWDGKAGERIAEAFLKIRKSLFEPETIKEGTRKIKTVRETLAAGG